MNGEILPIRIGPCRVCDCRRGVLVSAPGLPGGLRIGCPRCTRGGAEELAALVRAVPVAPEGGAA